MADALVLPALEASYLDDLGRRLDALDDRMLDSLERGARDWTILVERHWDELPEEKRADLRSMADAVDQTIRNEGFFKMLFGGFQALVAGLFLRRVKTLRLAAASAQLSKLRTAIRSKLQDESSSTERIMAVDDSEAVRRGHDELARGEGTTFTREQLLSRADGWQ
jgi:hypothetical protein